MLVSRKKSIKDKQEVEKSTTKCDIKAFFCFVCIERPTVGLHAMLIFVFRALSFVTGIGGRSKGGEENPIDVMDSNILLWIVIMFPMAFCFFHVGQSIAEVRVDEYGKLSNLQNVHMHEYMAVDSDESGSSSNEFASSTTNSAEGSQSVHSAHHSTNSNGSYVSATVSDNAEPKLHTHVDYTTQFLKRWLVILCFQFAIFVSGFFAPSGSPQWFPTLAVNVLVLGLVVETLFGTIKTENFRGWANKYHVVVIGILCVPIVFLIMFESVGLFMGSYGDYGQQYLQNVGTVGGAGNQMRGSNGSVGWWWGESSNIVIYVSSACWSGIFITLNLLPSILRCIGLRGRKGPPWLEDILIDTDGHIPLPKNGMDYHFFLTKHEMYKDTAVDIAKILVQLGFKIWISQFEEQGGAAIDSDGMQSGVDRSECLLLLMTHGIFHRNRHWVTETEVAYGVLTKLKPLLVIMPLRCEFPSDSDSSSSSSSDSSDDKSIERDEDENKGSLIACANREFTEVNNNINNSVSGEGSKTPTPTPTPTLLKQKNLHKLKKQKKRMFDLDHKCHLLKSSVHSRECWNGGDQIFQPLARAIPIACNVTKWDARNGSIAVNGETYVNAKHVRGSIRSLVQKYISSSDQQFKLIREYRKQRKIGFCPAKDEEFAAEYKSSERGSSGGFTPSGELKKGGIELTAVGL